MTLTYVDTATDITREHYARAGIKETIIRLSHDDGGYRWGNGDGWGWYVRDKYEKHAVNLSTVEGYEHLVDHHRVIYSTLNLFNADIFNLDYFKIDKKESPVISKEHIAGYTFGIDIDKGHGYDIHDPEVKQAVECMGQFFTDKFRAHAPNSVYVLYSGGGIYVMVHHGVLESYLNQLNTKKERVEGFTILLESFKLVIEEIRVEYFKLHPDHIGKVKPDSLNSAKRVFKSIFSIHKKLPYAVIPLNPTDIKINFDAARVPLSDDIIKTGATWYNDYDTDGGFIAYLQPYIEEVKAGNTMKTFNSITPTGSIYNREYEKAAHPIEDVEQYPPCVKNILNLESCGEGKTRALAFVAAFLGQMNVKKELAQRVFYGLAKHWQADTSNIFDSYYGVMRVQSCRKLTDKNNAGFPGVSLCGLNVCDPDMRCIGISSPWYYADKKANDSRLEWNITHTVNNKNGVGLKQ